MEGFTYHDIFDTKGIEYLIIIGFLIMLIPFWMVLNKQSKIVMQINRAWNVITAELLRIPQGLFFSKNHTWTYLEKSGNAKVGLDDFLMQVVGEVKVKNLKNSGEMIKKGELLAEIDQGGKNLRILSPISGTINSINPILLENPEILNEDPYDNGWFYSIRPVNWIGETKSYYLADEAKKWIHKELERLKDFLAVTIGKYSTESTVVALQEGGELRGKPLSELEPEIWRDFQKEFLDNIA